MEIGGIKLQKKYYFIDESGDPNFYGYRNAPLIGTQGFQPYLILGMIEAVNRKALRRAVVGFMYQIRNDVLYNTISSVVSKKGWYVHACGDHSEVRIQFFELLRKLDGFKAHIVVARKDVKVFEQWHNSKTADFYFDVLRELLTGKLDSKFQYQIYLSERQGNNMERFEKAVREASGDAEVCHYELELVNGKAVPELSIVDYMIWAVQRKLVKSEDRYFKSLSDKYGDVVRLYEEE